VRIAYLADGTMYYQNARPCKHCLDILKLYGIRRVYYTVHSPPGSINFYMERVDTMVSTHVTSGIRNMCDREYTRRDYRLT
jgi:tRNA(Arg) A34 adenosine deaminase TadA